MYIRSNYTYAHFMEEETKAKGLEAPNAFWPESDRKKRQLRLLKLCPKTDLEFNDEPAQDFN